MTVRSPVPWWGRPPEMLLFSAGAEATFPPPGLSGGWGLSGAERTGMAAGR